MVFAALFFIISCNSNQSRLNKAFELAQQTNYKPLVVNFSYFPIQIFYQEHQSKHAAIYIEGDGLVINSHGDIALNPTPTDPMALKLASVDRRSITKIVIHRPYHYVVSENPNSKYWTTARYAPEVIQSISEVIKICQRRFNFETIELIAYSGGASVALLLTSRIKGIIKLISFAGNLDHKSWTRYHDTEPLIESLDPIENREILAKIKQIHFLGTDDDNTTLDLGIKYKEQINSEMVKIIPIDGFSHDSNWPSIWKEQLMKLK